MKKRQFDLTVLYGLLLSLLAGIATTIRVVLAFLIKKLSVKFLGFSLGFLAGIIIQLSFFELLRNSINLVEFLTANIFFILGISLARAFHNNLVVNYSALV